MGASGLSRVLVVRLSSLGDVARLLPYLWGLRRASPSTRWDFTVEDRFAGLLDLFPAADRLVVYPRRAAGDPARNPIRFAAVVSRYLALLREGRYDLAVDLHGILRSAAVARLSGARVTAGFAKGFGKEGSHLWYTIPVIPGPSARMSRLERYERTLRALGFPLEIPQRLDPHLPEAAISAREEYLGREGLGMGKYVFAFVGTSRAQAFKRWPIERFEGAARILWESEGLPTVVGWGPEEASDVAGLGRSPHLRPAPATDLPALVAMIAGAAGYLGADTGATHLAALMGVPSVSILGPTDPVLNAPFGTRNRIVYREGIRSSCRGQACPHRDCMGLIGSADVAEALAGLLHERGPL